MEVDKLIIKVDEQHPESLVKCMHEMYVKLKGKSGGSGEYYYDTEAQELRFKGPKEESTKIGFHLDYEE